MSRRGVYDLSMTAVAVVLGLVWLWVARVSDGEEEFAPLRFELTGLVVAVLLFVWLRRSRPVLLALLVGVIGIALPSVAGLAAAALVGVASRRGARWAFLVFAVDAALILSLFQDEGGPTREYWETAAVLLMADLVLVTAGLLLRSHRALIRSLEERARQAEEGQRLRVEEARHLERERLAREMHDVLAHRISLLAVHAGALEVRRGASEEETRAAGVIRECAYDALEDLREVIGVLRAAPDADPDADRPQPGLAELGALVEESRRAGAWVDFTAGLPGDDPGRAGRHVYRIVQEGLTNARKHAPGARVRVTVGGGPGDGLSVELTNPAAVSGGLPGAGAGLIGLRERVDLVGGRIEHGWTETGDFRLRAWLPWRP
ncbi:signal transduction histidine kinase [Catenuloplanes nepalensis]|uniref:histidine kinase n=1 Tax=Catenuloplanes nepalensis TaxID=587533 RepID=A0ABT9MLI2_9ACTN|nr:histidine kinase [Catenuloplanes nepalensis]MDP9792280.1 signal transduction histidine kinase [Catenuloplanes nepalensis]